MAARLPESAPEAVREFLTRLDPEYWQRENPGDVAEHFRLAAGLAPERPARVRVVPREGGGFDVVVVAFDYFAELSILCGLLAVHGLDIESGHIHTFSPGVPTRGRRPPARKIVDVFRVRARGGRPGPDERALESELLALLALVADGRSLEAREQLNLRLVETLERLPSPPLPLPPVTVAFDNQASASWTVVDVRGPDSPGFLYALTNALAMRGLYVQQVRIETRGQEISDRFLVADREGRQILGEAEQETLRLAVVLIQQFTRFLTSAPDPARALRYFDQLLDRVLAEGGGGAARGLLGSPEGLRELACLLGSSAFLWEDFLRAQFEHLGPLLAQWRTRQLPDRAGQTQALLARLEGAADLAERRRRLNEFKDEQMLVVDMHQLLEPAASLESFSRSLTDLADIVLAQTLRIGREELTLTHGFPRGEDGLECPFAVFGLGKFGGGEMGYASDIELLCVYGGPGRTEKTGIENGDFFEALVQTATGLIEARQDGIFHVDLRLRPHGRKGALASSMPALRDYYREGGDAAPFERQALIKLRFVAGDPGLAREVEALRDAFVWSGASWDLATALHLRERQTRELVPLGRFNVKLSRGGLVDVEYAVQYLQIQHGRDQVSLRTPSTVAALRALHGGGLLSNTEHEDLRAAYLFWRRIADALRMVRGHAHDLLLPEEGGEEFRFLSRRLGYGGTDWEAAAQALAADVRLHRQHVAAFFDARFSRGAARGPSE